MGHVHAVRRAASGARVGDDGRDSLALAANAAVAARVDDGDTAAAVGRRPLLTLPGICQGNDHLVVAMLASTGPEASELVIHGAGSEMTIWLLVRSCCCKNLFRKQ